MAVATATWGAFGLSLDTGLGEHGWLLEGFFESNSGGGTGESKNLSDLHCCLF
jgi:hypothetical protein